jgi:hypothetical protein
MGVLERERERQREREGGREGGRDEGQESKVSAESSSDPGHSTKMVLSWSGNFCLREGLLLGVSQVSPGDKMAARWRHYCSINIQILRL